MMNKNNSIVMLMIAALSFSACSTHKVKQDPAMLEVLSMTDDEVKLYEELFAQRALAAGPIGGGEAVAKLLQEALESGITVSKEALLEDASLFFKPNQVGFKNLFGKAGDKTALSNAELDAWNVRQYKIHLQEKYPASFKFSESELAGVESRENTAAEEALNTSKLANAEEIANKVNVSKFPAVTAMLRKLQTVSQPLMLRFRSLFFRGGVQVFDEGTCMTTKEISKAALQNEIKIVQNLDDVNLAIHNKYPSSTYKTLADKLKRQSCLISEGAKSYAKDLIKLLNTPRGVAASTGRSLVRECHIIADGAMAQASFAYLEAYDANGIVPEVDFGTCAL